jgi:hypothetical protein
MLTQSTVMITRDYLITMTKLRLTEVFIYTIQDVPGGNVSILGVYSIDHSKQNSVYVHVSYSERFPR